MNMNRHKNACHENWQVSLPSGMKCITKVQYFSSLPRIKQENKLTEEKNYNAYIFASSLRSSK